MEKTFDFTSIEECPEQWRKVYVLRVLRGEELLEIEEEGMLAAAEKAGSLEAAKFDNKYSSLLLLQRAIKKPKLSIAQLKNMPAIPFNFLLEQARAMNYLKKKQRDFLLSKSSSIEKSR